MPFAGDQHPVQALAAGAGDPAFRGRVRRGARTGVLMIRTPIAVNTASKAAVNLGIPIPEQELEACAVSVILEVHQALLRWPIAGGWRLVW